MLSKLIQALQIFQKYGDPARPTHCEHDEFRVMIDPAIVSAEDKVTLKELGFFILRMINPAFISYRYGSA